MGNTESTSSTIDQSLLDLQQPEGTPIGINGSYTKREYQAVLQMQTRSSGSADITDIDGSVVFRCKTTGTLKHKKETYDDQGNTLFVSGEKWTTKTTHQAKDAKGDVLFSVEQQCFWQKLKFAVTFTNLDGRPMTIVLQRGPSCHEVVMKLHDENGPTIAHVDRIYDGVRKRMSDSPLYHITVAPGVDTSLVTGICLCVDQIRRDQEVLIATA